jgi:copper chaperone CopZ
LTKGNKPMKTARFSVEKKQLCGDCALALRRFIGGMDGVESIDEEQGEIAVRYDETVVNKEKLLKITRDSIEKLGYRLAESDE